MYFVADYENRKNKTLISMKNTTSLTTQQLALYIGCECMVLDKRGRLVKVDTEHLPCVNFPRGNETSNRQFVQRDQIQLLLTPLSEVKLEHLQSMANKHEYDEKYIRRYIDIPALEDVGTNHDFIRVEEDFRTAVWILNELRALGYDCDDLIPQGLAIDKSKL